MILRARGSNTDIKFYRAVNRVLHQLSKLRIDAARSTRRRGADHWGHVHQRLRDGYSLGSKTVGNDQTCPGFVAECSGDFDRLWFCRSLCCTNNHALAPVI